MSSEFARLEERAQLLQADIATAEKAGDHQRAAMLGLQLEEVRAKLRPFLDSETRHVNPESGRGARR